MLKIDHLKIPFNSNITYFQNFQEKGEVRDEDQAIAGQSDCQKT